MNTETKEKPFGHEAKILVRQLTVIGTGPLRDERIELVEKSIHRRGTESVVRRAARLVRGMQRIVSIEPYTKEQWVRCFGSGSENGSGWGAVR